MRVACVILWCLLPLCASAQGRDFTLSAPPRIVETGLLQHLLPRFSLKHGIRVSVVDDGGDAVIGTQGAEVFTGLGQVWSLSHDGGDGAVRFQDWLTSDVGLATLAAFQPDGAVIFSGAIAEPEIEVAVIPDGDVVEGERLSLLHCGRCHVVNEQNRMKGMGQTPSFALMRGFPDWQRRFAGFYRLNPHPSFSQVVGVTDPFRADLPPAIVPIELTEAMIDDIVTYVATIPPADLGAPLQSQ